jgi:hypothetical protein
MNVASLELLAGHTDEATALVVGDYPYGRRVRTSIRYWIETRPGKGDRFCAQTLNPKTGRWNKPKKSTYAAVGVMYREADSGHIKWTGLSEWADEDAIAQWMGALNDGHLTLSEEQRKNLAVVVGRHEAFKHVTWTVTSGESTPEEDAEQERIKRDVAKLVAVKTAQARRDLGA